jgi:hypothetical protein
MRACAAELLPATSVVDLYGTQTCCSMAYLIADDGVSGVPSQVRDPSFKRCFGLATFQRHGKQRT